MTYMFLAAVAAAWGGSSTMAATTAPVWAPAQRGDEWQAAATLVPGRAGARPALAIAFARLRPSQAGDHATLSRTVKVPRTGKARLSFTWSDDFGGATAGYHFAQVLVDGAVVWEADVAGAPAATPVTVDMPAEALRRGEAAVGVRVLEKQAVTNFPVRVVWADLRLEAEGHEPVVLLQLGARPAPAALPPDLPLPAAPPCPEPWLRQAVVLQPWGATQHAALTGVGERPRRLREEFGFNTIIVLPPEAHNIITGPDDHLTEAQFRSALEAYRAAGYKVILYSAVMHCGHAPVWQTGQLGREHPEWAQRDARGNVVMDYGAPWLCPSTPARGYTLDYTERLVREYGVDGIMLDNNQFFATLDGWTCHCASCTQAFREYARRRFGAEGVKRAFGADADALRIPVADGPLYALWLHWRNRVWGETNEEFRTRLRRVRPDILFFANTQYEFPDGLLAVDLQYEHEDVLLSESRGLTSWGMSQKMLLGQALAAGRPVWNYIGTFREDDFTRLREAEEVGPIVASSLAHGTRPWIVYYGFHDEQGEYRARKEMSTLLSWHSAHPELFSGARHAPVGVALSTRSRDLMQRPLIPPHLATLLHAGVPMVALRDEHLSAETLKGLRVLSLETAACLDDAAAGAVARWVRAGGTLVASVDAGSYDPLARMRPRSALWQALGVKSAPERVVPVGRGRAIAPEPDAFAASALELARPHSLLAQPAAGIEVVPYQAPGRTLLHLVRHSPDARTVTLRLPASLARPGATVRLHAPGKEPQALTLERDGQVVLLRVPEPPIYSVVEIAG